MINTKKKIVVTFSLIAVTVVLFFASFEFYVWQKHGYAHDYNQRQKCIEVSPLSAEEEELCQKYRTPD